MKRPRLLQVCNVGRIVGGTAACAWTVTRALPGFEHHVLFLSPPDVETLTAFAPCAVSHRLTVTAQDVERILPDVVLLHNTARSRLADRLPTPTLLYLHSAISEPAQADAAVCCSHWLATRIGLPRAHVLWQGVPNVGRRRTAAEKNGPFIVGRICTPQARKWPPDVVSFYAALAGRVPKICWEFVGCPEAMQGPLARACQQRAVFHPAGWRQRSLLSGWDVLLYSNPSLPESFGRTVAEAMRAGCVPVVDRFGGFVEQVPVGHGFLCTGVDEFSGALEHLSRQRDCLRTVSLRAVRHADEKFSLKRFATELLKWFDCARELSRRNLEETPLRNRCRAMTLQSD